MTAPRAVAITSLNQVEDKLRRNLNLAGDVGLQFAANMTPMVVAADATTIGNATFRGRRFAGAFTFNWLGPNSVGFKAGADLVISRIQVQSTNALEYTLRLSTSADTDPYAMTTPFAPWSERLASLTDFAPLLRSAVGAAGTSLGVLVHTWFGTANGKESMDDPIMMEVGDKLILNTTANPGTGYLSLYGYMY